MAMGKRSGDRQPPLWFATTDLPTEVSHPFYWRLNQLLREHGFGAFVEGTAPALAPKTSNAPDVSRRRGA